MPPAPVSIATRITYNPRSFHGMPAWMIRGDRFLGREGAYWHAVTAGIDRSGSHQVRRQRLDGAWYKGWYQAYVDFLDKKNLRKYFPDGGFADKVHRQPRDVLSRQNYRRTASAGQHQPTPYVIQRLGSRDFREPIRGSSTAGGTPRATRTSSPATTGRCMWRCKIRNKIAQTPATNYHGSSFGQPGRPQGRHNYSQPAHLWNPVARRIWQKSWPAVDLPAGMCRQLSSKKAVRSRYRHRAGLSTP